MLIAAALLGFGVGTVPARGLALAVRIAPDSRLSLANSAFYVLLDIGLGIGPLVLGMVQPLWGYAGLFLSLIHIYMAFGNASSTVPSSSSTSSLVKSAPSSR